MKNQEEKAKITKGRTGYTFKVLFKHSVNFNLAFSIKSVSNEFDVFVFFLVSTQLGQKDKYLSQRQLFIKSIIQTVLHDDF